jgi:hypothetical protein
VQYKSQSRGRFKLGRWLSMRVTAHRETNVWRFIESQCDIIAAQFNRTRPDVAKARALVALSTMIGAVTISRLVTDPELSATILRQTEKHLTEA